MKHSVSEGITLLEFVIYIFMCSILCVMAFSWGIYHYRQANLYSTQSSHLIDCATVCYVLNRDITCTPNDPDKWEKITDHEIIWKQGEAAIGWHTSDQKLFRIEGSYNSDKKQWKKNAKKALVMKDVSNITWSIEQKNNHIISVGYTFSTKNKTFNNQINLYQKVIYQ